MAIMATANRKKSSRFHNLILSRPREWVVMAAAVSLTIAAWFVSSHFVEVDKERQFQRRTTEIAEAISIRMRLYEQVLWGGSGYFSASNDIKRDEWKAYVDSLHLSEKWPGIQGVGFSIPVKPGEKEAHIASIRAEGFPEYMISPDGDRNEYSAIVFLEPFDWRNQRAFGYDMWSNDIRKQAMQRARDTGESSMSGIITLVQETEENPQVGFLMYVPVYS